MDSSNANINSGPILFRTSKYYQKDVHCSNGSKQNVWWGGIVLITQNFDPT